MRAHQYKCYYASPFASHIISPEAAVIAAMRAVTRLPGWLKPVLHVNEVSRAINCVWSPVIHGHFILRDKGGNWPWEEAMEWCLDCLENKGFDTLILSDTIPRKPGYGENGMDAEDELARCLGYPVLRHTEVEIRTGPP